MPKPRGSKVIEWAGEQWELLAERAVWWEREQTLIVADLHLGKAAAFRAAGVPVPEVIHAELERLGRLIGDVGAWRVMVVGDLIHSAEGRTNAVLAAVNEFVERRPDIAITLVRGNHDRRAGDPPSAWGMDVYDAPYIVGEEFDFALVHDPETEVCPGRVCIGGHLHPSVVVGDGSTSLRAPCFWVRERVMVLPAFGRFTGTRSIRPRVGDRVFAVGDGQVVEARGVAVRARAGGRKAAKQP